MAAIVMLLYGPMIPHDPRFAAVALVGGFVMYFAVDAGIRWADRVGAR